jgi:3-deoxy-D-manno-octulosonate 8-phosphate phosphatase (KDO 8-P phosphatase)
MVSCAGGILQKTLMSLEKRAAPIKLILSDVDGVLTDGTIEIDHDGNESKCFSTLDGYGIRMWHHAGYKMGLITGRNCPCIYHRAKNLGIEIVRAGTFAKWEAVLEIAAEANLSLDEIAFIGDDLPDLPAIRAVGLGVTVPHAPQELKNAAEYITQRPGGYGAVRDLIDQIFQVKRQATEPILR